MMAYWHYAKGSTRFGPVDMAEMKRLADSGELLPSDLVWTEGFESWIPATLGDPFGKMNEAISEKNRLKEKYQYALYNINDTHNKVKEIAARYGVVPH